MKPFVAGVYWDCTQDDKIKSYSRDIEENDKDNIKRYFSKTVKIPLEFTPICNEPKYLRIRMEINTIF